MKQRKLNLQTMKQINEEDLLKQLFGKIRMEEAPQDLTSKVMDQIMVNPEFDEVKRPGVEWWWFPVGLTGMLSMYFTGVFAFIYNLFAPYLVEFAVPLTRYFSFMSDLFPSNIVLVPSSFILPVILSGILLVILLDVLFKMQFRRIPEF